MESYESQHIGLVGNGIIVDEEEHPRLSILDYRFHALQMKGKIAGLCGYQGYSRVIVGIKRDSPSNKEHLAMDEFPV